MHASQYPVKVKFMVKKAWLSQSYSLSLFFFHTEINSILLCARYEILFSFAVITPKGEWTEFRALFLVFSSILWWAFWRFHLFSYCLIEITQHQLVNSTAFLPLTLNENWYKWNPWKSMKEEKKITADCCIPVACLACTCLEFGSVACHIASRSSFAFLMSFIHFCVARTTHQRSENVTQ